MASGPGLVVASAARTSTGNSGSLDAPGEGLTVLAVSVTAASGTTPSMTLSIEWSMDGGTTFHTVDTTADAFAAITTTTNVVKAFTTKGANYRIVWTISGTTPSFTFTVREMGMGA